MPGLGGEVDAQYGIHSIALRSPAPNGELSNSQFLVDTGARIGRRSDNSLSGYKEGLLQSRQKDHIQLRYYQFKWVKMQRWRSALGLDDFSSQHTQETD